MEFTLDFSSNENQQAASSNSSSNYSATWSSNYYPNQNYQQNIQQNSYSNYQQNPNQNMEMGFDQVKYATEADLDINSRIAMRSADDAKHVGAVEHIKLKPNTYIGSITRNPRQAYLYRDPNIPISTINTITNSNDPEAIPEEVPFIEQHLINIPEGAQRLYLEILFNAIDNMEKTRREGGVPGEVDVVVKDNWVIITNGGNPMPVDFKVAENMYTPTMLFSVPRTSDVYYKQHSTLCAQNGYGLKLAGIFSYEFIGEVGNALFVNEQGVKGRYFRQVWRNQLDETDGPEVTDGYTGPNFVRVAYRMKFDLFGYSSDSFYEQSTIDLYRFYAATAAFTGKCPVTFNGLRLQFSDISIFSQLFFTEKQNITRADHEIIHCQYPNGTELNKNGQPKNPSDRPYLEIIVIDTPDSAQVISFVNSMPTFNGGTHVNAVYQAVGTSFLKEINESKIATTKNIKLNITNLKSHLTVIVNYRVGQLDFDSQSKTKYDGKAPKVEIPEKLLAKLKNWDLMARLQADLRAKCYKSEPVTKKKRYIFDAKIEDANFAGTKRSAECTGIMVEGPSAMPYYRYMTDVYTQDFLGAVPLQGKPINSLNPAEEKIMENKVFARVKTFYNLKEGADYSDPTVLATLRYGKAMIMTDADHDGKHIAGLIILWFFARFPQLVSMGFLCFWRSPIVRVSKGTEKYNFYSDYSLDEWLAKMGGVIKGWKAKYCKGLGGASAANVKDDLVQPICPLIICDEQAKNTLLKAFDASMAQERKKWMAEHHGNYFDAYSQSLTITQLIDQEHILYSKYNLQRSIPGPDGLKNGQRKIICGMLKIWNGGKGAGTAGSSKAREIKVGRLANRIADLMNYHHGEQCLIMTIVNMAQEFVGTNNMPFFTAEGGFGSRYNGSKEVSKPRYIDTRPLWWIPYIYRKEDKPLYTFIPVEGEDFEPENMYPVLPTHLVNGVEGVATGWSTYIPPHNPLDLIAWLIARINKVTPEDPLPKFKPWFRGFKGKVKICDRSKEKAEIAKAFRAAKKAATDEAFKNRPTFTLDIEGYTDDSEVNSLADQEPVKIPTKPLEAYNPILNFNQVDTIDDVSLELLSDRKDTQMALDDLDDFDPNAKYYLRTEGDFRFLEKGDIEVTELPIRRWNVPYNLWLDKLIQDGTITGYTKRSTTNTANFIIHGMKGGVSLEKLRLIKTWGLRNLVMINQKYQPIKFDSIYHCMEYFYDWRIDGYRRRRAHELQFIQDNIDLKMFKKAFVYLVAVTGEIEVMNTPVAITHEQMTVHNLPHHIYDKTSAKDFSKDRIPVLEKEIADLHAKYAEIEKVKAGDLWINDLLEFREAYLKRMDKPAFLQ